MVIYIVPKFKYKILMQIKATGKTVTSLAGAVPLQTTSTPVRNTDRGSSNTLAFKIITYFIQIMLRNTFCLHIISSVKVSKDIS